MITFLLQFLTVEHYIAQLDKQYWWVFKIKVLEHAEQRVHQTFLLHFKYISLLAVICYLATFQLEELGLQHFSRIVKSLDTVKMHKVIKVQFFLH